MARRTPYTRVEKEGQSRPPHVRGQGDVVYKGFQCLNGDCKEFIVIREDEIGPDFKITCQTCGFLHGAGQETRFFKYRLVHRSDDRVIEEGDFVVLHDDYIRETQRFKYCLLCYALKPLEFFDVHRARRSGRQGECRICKTLYNGIKNQSRITDQHREAAQRRRLYQRLTGRTGNIDSAAIYRKFGGACFKCGRRLTDRKEINLDHTLPARLLWPLTTDNATLLCSACNNEKHDRWPSEFYDIRQLKRLAVMTGYPYDLIASQPTVNEDSILKILEDTDAFIEEFIRYPNEIKRVRRLIREYGNVDIFEHARHVPDYLQEPDE